MAVIGGARVVRAIVVIITVIRTLGMLEIWGQFAGYGDLHYEGADGSNLVVEVEFYSEEERKGKDTVAVSLSLTLHNPIR